MEVEPLASRRHVAITEHRARKDWAIQIKQMLDERYSSVFKMRLVMDNLNTHTIIASLYKTFDPKETKLFNGTASYPLYAEIRQLAQYGKDRTQCPEGTMPWLKRFYPKL